jgi:hypothetical protein
MLTERPQTLQPLWFVQAHVRGLTISLEDRHLMAAWSQFEDCTFTQRRRGPVLNASGEAAQGSFGNAPCLYQGCRFVSVRFKARGGFSLDRGRVEGCTFDRCRFNGHLHSSADLVDCTFIGPIDGCNWVGQYHGPNESRRNIITGNDLTAAVITSNVGWYDFPINAQRWPAGYRPTNG